MTTERTPCPEPGLYYGISEQVYRAWDAENHSTLKMVDVSMERYKHCRDHGGGDDSQARLEGRVLHAYILEPAEAATRYVATPREYPTLVKAKDAECTIKATDKTGRNFVVARGRGKAREEWQYVLEPESTGEDWLGHSEVPSGLVEIEMRPWTNSANFCSCWSDAIREKGGEVISHDSLAMCKGMAARLREIPDVKGLFDGASFEVSVVWIDEATGLKCKCRVDLLNLCLNIELADIKTSMAPVSHDSFAWTVKKWSYASQGAMYIDGVKAALKAIGKPHDGLASFTFMAGEKVEPYTPALWDLLDEYNDGMELCQPGSSSWLQYGRALYRGWLEKVAKARKDDFWPGYYKEPEKFPRREELLVPSRILLTVDGDEI